jgi:uncharacterized membrane protein
MKLLLVLLGLLLTLFGLVMCFGTIMGWAESEYSVTTDIAGFVFMGIAPLLVGTGLLVTGIVLLLRGRSEQEPKHSDNAA